MYSLARGRSSVNWGGGGGLPASGASKHRQGSGGEAPTGVLEQSFIDILSLISRKVEKSILLCLIFFSSNFQFLIKKFHKKEISITSLDLIFVKVPPPSSGSIPESSLLVRCFPNVALKILHVAWSSLLTRQKLMLAH